MPYAWVVLLMGLYTRFDSILLERMLPDGALQADVFAGAYRLLDAANMLGFLFASLLLPMFARQLGRKESPRALLSFSFKLMWAGSFGLCVAVYLARFDLTALMFSGKTDIAHRADVLGILIWGFLAMSMTYIFSTLLTADERLRQMNRFFLIAIIIDLSLNLLLVKELKAQGSAISVVSTQGFVALGMIYLCIRIYGFVPSWKTVIQLVVFCLLLAILGQWCYASLDQVWEVKFALVLLLALIAALLTGLMDWRTIRMLYRKESV
jgi:O-antigen/teichoic acid export membrane protein